MLGSKLAECFLGQVVRFVDAVEAVFRVGQNHAAAHADVDHQQIVVGDDDIDGFQRAEEYQKLKDCIDAALASSEGVQYAYDGFNQSKGAGRTKICVHYFRIEKAKK